MNFSTFTFVVQKTVDQISGKYLSWTAVTLFVGTFLVIHDFWSVQRRSSLHFVA